jgi:hypothetical protein
MTEWASPCVGLCQSTRARIFHFTEIRFWRMCGPSRLTKRGDLEVVLIASRACGGRGSVGMRGAGRAGSPCELVAACRRTALFSSSRHILSATSTRPGDNVVTSERAYGKTVWSWPSLLRSSSCGGASESNRADCIIQIRGAREARRKVRLPGEHGISRPTIAQGRPSDRHHLYAAVRFFLRVHSRSGPRVPVGTRSSLRPCVLEICQNVATGGWIRTARCRN